jgi:hypothetical protein
MNYPLRRVLSAGVAATMTVAGGAGEFKVSVPSQKVDGPKQDNVASRRVGLMIMITTGTSVRSCSLWVSLRRRRKKNVSSSCKHSPGLVDKMSTKFFQCT